MQDAANAPDTPLGDASPTTGEDYAQRILRFINPKSLPAIPLDDLVVLTQRHLLLRVPAAYRASLKCTLQNYVFDHRTFHISPQELLLCLKAPLSAPQPANVPISPITQKQQPLFESPDCGKCSVPIPHSIRKAIRDLSKERKFIAYGDDMKKGLSKAVPDKKEDRGRDTHKRGSSAAGGVGRKREDGYSFTHPRKPSNPAFTFSEVMVCQTPDSRSNPTRKLWSGPKLLDLSFVSSTAATPKNAALRHSSFSPKARVVVPSLREGMEKIIKERVMQ